MVPRYETAELRELLGDRARLARWLLIERELVAALAEAGIVPQVEAQQFEQRLPRVDAQLEERWHDRELVIDHDVAAFIDVIEDAVGQPAGRWVHYGLTSSDVVDTANGMALRAAGEVILAAAGQLADLILTLAKTYSGLLMIGRTHGRHAELTTLGHKLLVHAARLVRDVRRLRQATDQVAVGKLSGPVGTYAEFDQQIERLVLDRLGLSAVPSSQIVPRDIYADLTAACASISTTVEGLATDVRLLSQSEVNEVGTLEFERAKGSSSMPHKQNPARLERLCGMATIVRSGHAGVLSSATSWNEHDLRHSAVERTLLPDVLFATHFQLTDAVSIFSSFSANRELIASHVAEHTSVSSAGALLTLIRNGSPRDAAFRQLQQEAASRSSDSTEPTIQPSVERQEQERDDYGERVAAFVTAEVSRVRAELKRHLGADDLNP